MRLSIQAKIFAGFVALLIIFGGISGYTAWQVRALSQTLGVLHQAVVPLPAILTEVQSDLVGLERLAEQDDPAMLRRGVHLARRVYPYSARISERLERARARIDDATSADLRDVRAGLDDVERELRAMNPALEAFYAAVESGEAIAEARRGDLRRSLRRLGRAVARVRLTATDRLDRAVAAFAREEQRAVFNALILAALAMVVGLGITLSAGVTLRPLRVLREAVERIARGDYDRPVGIDRSDEIGALARAIDSMSQAIRTRDDQLSTQQKELLHRERLATVGRMSAQITHELRNPLSSIGLNSELLMEELEQLDEGEESRELLSSIIREVERLREITEEYLRFARLPRPEIQPVDLNQIARELLEFVRGEMEQAGVKARLDADPAGRPALADPNQVRAALLNLLRNAREALEAAEPGGGHVVIRVRSLGSQVTVEVSDDGPGLDEEASRRLFEPFFSSKPQGTGLGLPMVQKILEAQSGAVEVESDTGRGTTVRLRLPPAPEGDSA